MPASYELDGQLRVARLQLQTLNNQLATSSQTLEKELQNARNAAEQKTRKLSFAMKDVQRRLTRKEQRAHRKADERNKEIERLKLVAQNRLNARLFRLCPISALPEETLFEIFDILISDLDMSPTILWLVCKRWRTVVQFCGSLWRFTEIRYNPARRISIKGKFTCCSDESVLQIALKRAREAPLHILLSLHSLNECSLQNDAVKLLFSDQVAYRIETLDLPESCSYLYGVVGVGYFDRVSTLLPEPILKTRHDTEGFPLTALSSLKTLAFDVLEDLPFWDAISSSIVRTSTLLQNLVIRSPDGLDLLPDSVAIQTRHLVYEGVDEQWVTPSFARFRNIQTLKLEAAYFIYHKIDVTPTLNFPMPSLACLSLVPAYLVKGWGLPSLHELDIRVTDIVDPTMSISLPLLQKLRLYGCTSVVRQPLILAPRLQTLLLCVKQLHCDCCRCESCDEDDDEDEMMVDKDSFDIKAVLTNLNASRLQSCHLDLQGCEFLVETQLLLLAIQEMEQLTSLTIAVKELYHIRPLLTALTIPTRGFGKGWRPLLCPLLQCLTLDVLSTQEEDVDKSSAGIPLLADQIFEARGSMEAPLRWLLMKCVYKGDHQTEEGLAVGPGTPPLVERSVVVSLSSQ